MKAYELQQGQMFKLPDPNPVSGPNLFRFDHMDGMYCYAVQEETGKVLNWSGPVEVVDD